MATPPPILFNLSIFEISWSLGELQLFSCFSPSVFSDRVATGGGEGARQSLELLSLKKCAADMDQVEEVLN